MVNALLSINAVLTDDIWRRVEKAVRRYFGLVARRAGQARLVAFDPLPGFDSDGPIDAATDLWTLLAPEPGTPLVICVLYGDPGGAAADHQRLELLEAEARQLGRPVCIVGLPFPDTMAHRSWLGPTHSAAGGWRELEIPPGHTVLASVGETEPEPAPEANPEAEVEVPDPADLRSRADRRVIASPGDSVVATVFAPPTVRPEEPFLVQVFAHDALEADLAGSLAQETDPDSTRRVFKTLAVPVPNGTTLSFQLLIPGARIEDPIASLTWRKSAEAVQFEVVVPPGGPPRLIGTVVVSIDSVPVGHLKFAIRVAWLTGWIKPAGDDATRYRSAFVSYASQDRDAVLARVQMLGPLGIQFFQDVMSLSPGDRWERQLYRYIDECDLFLLFWSRAARESEWVEKEVAHALARRGPTELGRPEIVPVILEGPPIVPPPPALTGVHFDDRVLYFRSCGNPSS